MQKPKNLDDTASKFYDKHAKRLKDQGLLTASTFDSFILLCRTHSLIDRLDVDSDPKTGVIKWIGLTRVYQALARGFALNSDKPRQPEQGTEPDEFGI